MTKADFIKHMVVAVRTLDGGGRTQDEIIADLIAADPWFATREILLRIMLTDYYNVPTHSAPQSFP